MTTNASARNQRHEDKAGHHGTSNRMYWIFAAILLVNLGLMWVLTMSMIRTWDHFYFNPSNLYMAFIMVTAMAILMVVGMWSMFQNTKLNIALLIGFIALFVAALLFGRAEVGVGNEGFLKSMIPHHSRAILVCQESNITDPEIQDLCATIVETQQEEIAQMQDILTRYE
ncbi:DUF305 domain-containing protein [Kocuria carniphila]|uniref:DUF305 domain-containing protein n=1 Tax=Kocuria carniphila TaxID=262208 RepID=UPI00101B5CEF|nr:DUF305 domain-containing protein [Kocuria carniphila]